MVSTCTNQNTAIKGHEMFKFTDLDWKCINTIRGLSIDMVAKANSGHPGAPMGCAPLAHVLFTRFLQANPKDPKWINRDRFIMSNGHGCALQYALLHLLGYPLSMDDLRSFRQLDSLTAGHPESHITPGVEATTGPLGQGIANAVGAAIAEAHLAATFNRPEATLIDNYTFVLAGDGCMMEGISSEACSLAGHLKLGKLIILYDDNLISIDGSTALAFTEDVSKRFESYGFHCQYVANGDADLEGIARAIQAAKETKDRPSLIRIRTTIGFGSAAAGTEKVHGSPLAADDVVSTKERLGLADPKATFAVPSDVRDYYSEVAQRGERKAKQWTTYLGTSYSAAFPREAEEFHRRLRGELPASWKTLLPQYKAGGAEMATRKASELVLNAIVDQLPELVGGSADLTPSNLTKWKNSQDFQHPSTGLGAYAGRYFRFGVREHAMFGICNGLAAYGNPGFLVPFCSTFLNFITYGWGAVRLSALSHLQVIYVMTHDSIGLGEDGPTHQPIETLAGLRALPNCLVIRPADGNEVSGAYLAAMENHSGPTILCLSRQNLPQLNGSSLDGVLRGAYILEEPQDNAKAAIVLVGTGSEMAICKAAATILEKEHKIAVRLVSMPSWELFNRQSIDYQLSVFPTGVPALSCEALSTLGWQKYVHASVGVDQFGASGPYKEVYRKMGITGENVADRALKLLHFYRDHPLPSLLARPF